MATLPRPPSQSHVSRAAALRAVDSLLKWSRAQRNPKNAAAACHDDPIYLILTLTKAPQNLHSKSYPIPLPHPLHDPSAVSLVVDDRPNSLFTLTAASDLVRSLSLPISQILSISDLRSGISPDGELLFADRRIARLLRSFKQKRKSKRKRNVPVEVDFLRKSWPEYVRRVCFSTVLNLGHCTCSIRVGRALQGRDEIVENVLSAVDGTVRNVPRKWSNVMSFHLKTSESLALPIYVKSDWVHKKVDGDDDDEDDAEEERTVVCKELEVEKRRKKDKSVEGATRKRARDDSELHGAEVTKIKRKTLRYVIGR